MRHNSRKQKTKMEGYEFCRAHKEKMGGMLISSNCVQLHKLAKNFPPLKDEGIILHPTFVFFVQHSIVDPDLCFFCLKNCKVLHIFETWSIVVDMIHMLVLQTRKSTDDFKISEKRKESQCRRILTYSQMIELELYLARQQIKDGLQHHEKKPDFSYKILQQLSDRISLHFWMRYFNIYFFKF